MKNSQLFFVSLGLFLSACSIDSSLKDTGGSSGSSQEPVGPKASIKSELEGTTANPQIPVSITFTEDVTGFEVGDLIVSEGSISNFTGSGRTYSFTLNMVSDAAVTIRLAEGAATGVSGRPNQAVVQLIVGFVPAATTAILSSLPPSISNQTVLAIGVAGSGVTSYHYKLGESASTNCSVSTGYSVSIGEEVDITNDVSSLSEGELRLCVIGLSEHSQQSYASATTYSWTKDTIAPSLTGLANDNTWAKSKTWNWGCDEVCTYSYAVDTNASTAPSGAFSTDLTTAQSAGNGRHYLHIVAKDAAGNESSPAHFHVDIDNQGPITPGSVNDSALSTSLTQSPTISWSASSDTSGSGVSHYEYAIGTTAGGTTITDWTREDSTSVQVSGLSLSNGTTYYASIRAIDNAGNISFVSQGDGWLVDNNPPSVISDLASASDSSLSQTPTLTWTAATDGESGINRYQIAIGTSAGAVDILNWKNIGNVSSHQESGLSFNSGTNYYASIRAVDNAGNFGSVVTSSGFVNSQSQCLAGGGFEYNSRCYALSNQKSCSTACARINAGFSQDASNYAISTTGTCSAILDGQNAIGGAPAFTDPATCNYGCSAYWDTPGTYPWYVTGRRVCSSASGTVVPDHNITMACGCTFSDTPDYTPEPLNWTNFTWRSSAEIFSGINRILEIQVSATLVTGTPTISYQLVAGGAFVELSPGTPQNITVRAADTLIFQVLGTGGHKASITVTNISDGSTELATVEGTALDCVGGYIEGGHCWYLGALNENCDTVCSNRSYSYSSATTSYLSTSTRCHTLLESLFGPAAASSSSGCYDGCNISGGARRYCSGSIPLSTRSSTTARRACACQ